LAWLIRQGFSSSIDLLDKTFDVQDYAFALPGNSPLRKPVNVAVLDARRSEWWDQTTFQYLGTK
jgi:polar amino acid transport system substrate-binding protein